MQSYSRPRQSKWEEPPAAAPFFKPVGRINRIRLLARSSTWTFFVLLMAYIGLEIQGPMGLIIAVPFILLFFYAGIVAFAQRCHDLGFSGWFSLLVLIPYIGGLCSLFLLIWPGNSSENDHGEPPMAADGGEILMALIFLGLVAYIGYSQYTTLVTLLAVAND
ncbi:MAG: DUF805 domain-containing protein [Acidobacteria bacterium]|nr:DUF805 domain-containing protein [Acidobacteriota bacterium]